MKQRTNQLSLSGQRVTPAAVAPGAPVDPNAHRRRSVKEMTEYTILPLNAHTMLPYGKHMATLVAWTATVFLGLGLWQRTKRPWWTLFSIGYAIQLVRIVVDCARLGFPPLPLQSTTVTGPTSQTLTSVVLWDVTGIFVALALIWALWKAEKKKATEPAVPAYPAARGR